MRAVDLQALGNAEPREPARLSLRQTALLWTASAAAGWLVTVALVWVVVRML